MSRDAMMTDDLSWREFGDAMKQAGKERRAANRENSAAILAERGIAIETHNDGAHLIVRHNGRNEARACKRGSPAWKIAVAKAIVYLRENPDQVWLSIRGHLRIGVLASPPDAAVRVTEAIRPYTKRRLLERAADYDKGGEFAKAKAIGIRSAIEEIEMDAALQGGEGRA